MLNIIKNWNRFFSKWEEQPVPFFIESIQWEGNRFMIKFNEINSMEEASLLLGKKILLPVSELPELEDGDFYLHELIGMEVIDQNLKSLGKVISFFDQPPQEMIEVDYGGKGLLIPLTEEIVKGIELEKGTIEVNLPDGYIEALLSE